MKMIKKRVIWKILVFLVGFIVFFISGVMAQAVVCEESIPLFTASDKIYINEPLNSIKTILSKSELPGLLTDGVFIGNVDTRYTQYIEIGSYPKVVFAKQPSIFNDPLYGLMLIPVSNNYFYKTVISFDKPVDFSNLDSRRQEINLFGVKFIILPTTNSDLVLLRNAETIRLSSDNLIQNVNLGGDSYRIEIISATDTSATIKVTNNLGVSEVKEVNERTSKIINGIIVAVDETDETNLKLGALVVVAKDQIILRDEGNILAGTDETVIEGTLVKLDGGINTLTKLEISVFAPNSDNDALLPGNTFRDPVFGTFKVDFRGFNINEDNTNMREQIYIKPSGDDKMTVTFTEHGGNSKTVQFAKGYSNDRIELEEDDEGRKISIFEMEKAFIRGYVVLGNEEEGYLVRVSMITNQAGTTNDRVEFTDIFSGGTYISRITTDGLANVVVGTTSYNVYYEGTSSDDSNNVRINYPDSAPAGTDAVIYPTIETKKGAKVSFYKPMRIELNNWDGKANKLFNLKFPDGDGYTDIAFGDQGSGIWRVNGNNLNSLDKNSFVSFPIGKLNYNVRGSGTINKIDIYLKNERGEEITNPAMVIFEEKSFEEEVYNALIVTLEPGNTLNDGIGVDDVIRTWSNDAEWDSIVLSSDNKKSKEADKYGTVVTIDSSDADQKSAYINYPDQQVYANIYVTDNVCRSPEEPFIEESNDNLVYHYYGRAINLDGVDDFVDLGISDSLNPLEEMTISAWVNLRALGNFPIVERYTATSGLRSYFLSITNEGDVLFHVYNEAEAPVIVRVNKGINVGTWNHIVGVYDSGGNAKIYINGEPKSSTESKGNIKKTKQSTTIGGLINSNNKYFNGYLRDVRIYRRILNEEEIEEMYYRIENSINTDPIYDEHCGELGGTNLEYCKIFNSLDLRQSYGNGFKFSDDAGPLAWSESNVLQGYILLYQKTLDKYWLNKLIDHIDNVLAHRDDYLNRADYRGIVAAGWSSNNPTYSINGARYRHLVHNGKITYPIISFSAIIYRDENLKNDLYYKQKADFYIGEVRKVVMAHEFQWKKGPDSIALENEGYYRWESGAPVRTPGRYLPINQMLAMGNTLIILNELTENSDYLDKINRMGRIFKRHLFVGSGDFYFWRYSFSGSNPFEDISHAVIDIDFVLESYKHNMLFDEENMKKFANTFRKKIFKNRYDEVNKRVDGSENCRVSDCAYFPRVGNWAELALFDPIIDDIIAEIYAKNGFSANLNPYYRLAYAQLIGMDNQVIVRGVAPDVELREADNPEEEFEIRQESDEDVSFIRGDSDKDGRVTLTDAVRILSYLFQGGEIPSCLDAADVDDNGKVDLTDAIKILNFLFNGGNPPQQPFPEIGEDPTPDGLEC